MIDWYMMGEKLKSCTVVTSQLGDYCFLPSFSFIIQQLHSYYILDVSFFIVWEDNKKWKLFSWVSTDVPFIYSSNRKFTIEAKNDVLLLLSCTSVCFRTKTVISLKLSLSKFSSCRFSMWSGFYFNLPFFFKSVITSYKDKMVLYYP